MTKVAGPLLFAAILYAALWFLANRSVYFPFQYPKGEWEAQAGVGAQDVWLTAADGVKLHAWWVEAPGARLSTLFLHGNAGNLTHRVGHIREIVAAGSSVLVLDYRGYGRSQGRPTEHGLYADADASLEWLAARGAPVVLHGESLGSAVAVDLAVRKPCAGLVLEAPFSSARAVAASVLPVIGPLLIWGFDAKGKIGGLRAPLLVMHGDRDEVIGYALGRELFAEAPEPKEFWTLPGSGHNNIVESGGPEYRRRLAAFYARILPGR